ncbi:acid protease [Amylocystis lapponica]|nr:acid protease [Amylocystis lapponica]
MFRSLSALTLVASAAIVGAVTLNLDPVNGRTGSYLLGVPEADRARAAFLKSRGSARVTTVPATQLAYVQYTLSVGVGSPATYYNIVLDTGSSNTFVGTGKKYVRTSTSIPTGEEVNVTYGSGFFSGYEYIDQVTIAPDFVIRNQSIGDALQSADFEGVDGIIGVGPLILTEGTLYPDANATIQTVTGNALTQGLIQTEVIGVYFAPATKYSQANGAYYGEITYTPVTQTSPSSYYWGINVTGATYGNEMVIPGSYAGIVDTGTTLIYIADDWFKTYQAAIPGSYFDNSTGLIVIPNRPCQPFVPWTSPSANKAWGGEPGVQYGYVGPLGAFSGEGLDFIMDRNSWNGSTRSIFDTTNNRVGFAYT